jgi:alpha-2-macroglobulin
MRSLKSISLILTLLLLYSCENRETKNFSDRFKKDSSKEFYINIPLDKGFSEYIASYTSGMVASNSSIEIRFTPEFASKVNKAAVGLFTFNPSLNGKTEWKDETTLVFTPSRLLDPGKTYTGGLNLAKLGTVQERLKIFPLRFQTIRKDFRVTIGELECKNGGMDGYVLHGEIVTSDYVENKEAENYIKAKLERKRVDITWDHSANPVHKFTIDDIERKKEGQGLIVSWDGKGYGIKQKGATLIEIPRSGEFMILDVIVSQGEAQKVDLIFSDPLEASQEMDGLIRFTPAIETNISTKSNIVSIFPKGRFQGTITLNIEQSVKNIKGTELSVPFTREFDFTAIPPSIKTEGKGVIVPSSKNLVFPFMAVNLKAVDLRIVKIYENNLQYFLQENDLNGNSEIKRFGRPVYSGRVDLINSPGMNTWKWNLYTIDLADYIETEPGVLYKVTLGMRKSYSLYPCGDQGVKSKYELALEQYENEDKDTWDDAENYYNDSDNDLYYEFNFDWRQRENPCEEAYYYPERGGSRNILSSDIGLIAKKGEDNILHVMANDLISAMPLNGVTIDVFDFQMQPIISGETDQKGEVALFCERKPFLVVAKKDKDRNYLKVNDGSSLSLSSFDVSGSTPEKGIKAFVYGERDVWRPGDSIFLSVFIKDMLSDLPSGHPVQFELINPLEQKVDNQVLKTSGSNLIVFGTKTSADAVTGNYRAVFRIGGATFTKRVRIETVKPNRLKLKLEFPYEILGGSNPSAKGTLNVKWLNGSIAKNLRSNVEYLLRHTKTEFERYSQYEFDDPANRFWAETVRIFDNTLDDNGNATITFEPGKELKAPGMLNAVFTVKAAEPGGDESITQATYKYAPYPVFVGINFPGLKGRERMLFTDRDNEVKIVTVDENGKPVRSEVQVEIYKISYRWWWESEEENLGSYISGNEYKPVFEKTLTTSGGEASFTFNIDKNDWGRYLIRATAPTGHSTGKILLVDWPWDYGMKNNSDGATLLSVTTDKEKYRPGEEVRLSFPSPENSRAIVTLENSTGVLDEMRVSTEKGNTVVTFKARPEMAPNVYAYVSVIQPHAQSINDMPVRLYGITPVMVEDPATRLSPVIEMADELRSQKPFTINVREEHKQAMSYTVAVVDEGLLDLTGFKTPNPWGYFYAREALGVKTWDLYDMVLGAFGGTLEKALATGGDEALGDKSAGKANRFVPVVRFLGPFTLKAGQTNSHVISLPQYTGSVRTMIVAGNDRSFGMAEKAVPVKDPLMVLVTAPRVISPGEKVSLPLSLFIQKDGIKDITIKAESNDLITFRESTLNLTASGIGEKDAELFFTAGSKRGTARITVTASGGGETAVYKMELEIRSPNPSVTRSEFKVIKKGEKFETSFKPFGLEGSNSAVLEVSPFPSINLDKHLDYLVHYPYGCSEQVTSAAFPQLWIRELRKTSEWENQNISTNISKAISILISRQMADGGIALWPGSAQPDLWVTSYAGHFITEAERLGFNIPSGFRQKWISFQKKRANEWRYEAMYGYTAADQAYRLFTLAVAGEPDRGAMNRLRESKNIPQIARWMLAAAYARSGRPEVATTLLDVRVTKTEPEYYDYYYGSDMRDKAVILYTLSLLNNIEQELPLLKEICDNFNRDYWYSTQSLGWGLFAYIKCVQSLPGDKNVPPVIRININGDKSEQTLFSKQLWSKELKITEGNNNLSVENISEQPLYVTLAKKGIPMQSDMLREEKGLVMKVEYLDQKMKPIDQKSLEQGTDFMMIARVTNNTFSSIGNIALTEMVPSGWEIRNTRLFEAVNGIKESSYDYRDFRDDRVNTFFSLGSGETKTFVLMVNAAYKGEFYQPAIWCEAMYKADCYSRFPGSSVKVYRK